MKNWIRRALRTALQAAVGYLVVAVPAVDWGADKAILRTTLVGIGVTAAAAAVAAVMNLDEDQEDKQ